MLTIEVVYEHANLSERQSAAALKKYAPAGYALRLVPGGSDRAAPSELAQQTVDIVLLLSPRMAPSVRNALSAAGADTKLLVRWISRWPLNLETFHSVYQQADQVLLSCPTYWQRLGPLPRTRLLREAFDAEVFGPGIARSSEGPDVLLLKTAFTQRRRDYSRVVDRYASEGRLSAQIFDVAGSYNTAALEPTRARLYAQAKALVWDPDCAESISYALEAAACDCTPIALARRTKDLGTSETFPGQTVARTYEALSEAIDGAVKSYDQRASRLDDHMAIWSWAERIGDYSAAFHAAAEAGTARSRGPATDKLTDLTEEVTVFVTTVGAPCYPACREHLRLQDSRFVLKEIRNVAPMSTAFQQMLEDCNTPYYVQVDEDMLLYPHAVRALYETIVKADEDVALYAAPLFDVHLDRPIDAVKIFRHAIGRHYPFRDIVTCDIERNRRMQADGFRVLKPPSQRASECHEAILGLHGPHWTPTSIYERYATLQRARAEDPRVLQWLGDFSGEFMARFLDDPCELNFFALMGLAAGTLGAHGGEHREKDYRTYAKPPGGAHLEAFLREVTSRDA